MDIDLSAPDDRLRVLEAWFDSQLVTADEVRIEDLDRAEMGHSAETLLLTLVELTGTVELRRNIVLRLRPPVPGLLEPYDMQKQFDVLRGLHGTSVHAPEALFIEPTGTVLGREFYVMSRVDGEVWEQQRIPADMEASGRLRRMCESMVDELAAIHRVDLEATGLSVLGDGAAFLDRELDWWESELRRVQRGPLPAIERLLDELRQTRPQQCSRVSLVHGDAKPGNFAFVGDTVAAVYDWEMAAIGDPLTDIGYLDVLWSMPAGLTSRPTSLTADEFVARYEQRSGIAVEHREWYRAMQVFKLAAIQLVGSMLVDAGEWNDPRGIGMAHGIEMMVPIGLRALGIDERLEMGPIFPREERINEVLGSARR